MKVVFSQRALEDYEYWKQNDLPKVEKIKNLIAAIKQDPFKGVGRPEPLKHELKGWWSRRITREHRLVYRVSGKNPDQILDVSQCRFHYDD